MKIDYKPVTLQLKHPFGISREVKESVTSVFVRLTYEHNGQTYSGYGEAAPSRFYGESADSVVAFYKWVEDQNILDSSPYEIVNINRQLNKTGRNYAAKAAIDIALYDLIGKMNNIPAYKYLGFSNKLPKTSYTIDISDLDMILKKTETALSSGYDILKVKLGTDTDEKIILSIRQAAPEAVIRVDANAAWDLKTALKLIRVLEDNNVELIEQPLAQNNLKDLEILRRATSIPIIVDESCIFSSDIANLHGIVDGINIKLSKCGGITESLKLLHTARAFNLKVMVGCFLETSLGIAAASIIATQADYVDLDGCLLLKEDPFNILTYDKSSIYIPEVPGISTGDIF